MKKFKQSFENYQLKTSRFREVFCSAWSKKTEPNSIGSDFFYAKIFILLKMLHIEQPHSKLIYHSSPNKSEYLLRPIPFCHSQ